MAGPFFPVPSAEERKKRATKAQLAARKEDGEVRQSIRERRLDARRKIILGGALLAHARADPTAAEHLHQLLRDWIGDRDRKVFEGWTP